MLGTLLAGRYKIVRVLGTGGFGQTYIAEDTRHPEQSVCVVKHLQPASHDSKFLAIARRLFQTEAEMLRKLGQHDQIPTLLASFEEDGEFYLVQEYIDGYLFGDEISGGFRLGEVQVIAFLEDVLHILKFVHDHHVIHRDIKPGNLIHRTRDGKLVLIDFGAVKEIGTQIMSGPGQTGFTVGIGTQGYTPGEQLAGKPRYSSDIYALGMTAIQALTGLQPSQIPENPDTAEVLWQEHATVSPGLAILLNKMVRQHFTQRYQSVDEVLRDLSRLDELPQEASLEDALPLTRLPQETWMQRLRRGVSVIAIASLAVTGLGAGLRQLGVLESFELAAYDQMMRLRPALDPDPRLLVVGITEADLRTLQRSTPSDQTIAQAIAQLQQYNPRVIGVDLYREVPQEPGREALLEQLAAPNLVAIAEMGTGDTLHIPPPPEVPLDRVGFNDLVLDPDRFIRRNLMFASFQDQVMYSFSLRLALAYLEAEGIQPQNSDRHPEAMQLANTLFLPITSHSGGYQTIDAEGYQILLDYRSPSQAARQVSLTQVLEGQIEPEWVQGKVVLIGTIAPSGKDLFYTPFSATHDEEVQMPGVTIHAQMVSQILSAVLEERSLFWFWPEWLEIGWMLLWAIAGSGLAWFVRRPMLLVLSGAGLFIIIVGTSVLLFFQQGWIPVVAPTVIYVTAGIVVVLYRMYDAQRQEDSIATLLAHPTNIKDSLRP